MTRSRKIQVAALGIGLAALTAGIATGEVLIKAHPGFQCVEMWDTTPEIYYSSGRAYNDAGFTNYWSCPAPNTYMETDTQNFFDEIMWWASVSDQSPTGNISCHLRSCTSDGSSCVTSVTETSSGTGVQTLSTVGNVLGPRVYTDFVYLYCSIPGENPGMSGVISYTTYEF